MIAGGRLHPSFDYSQPTFDLIVASPLFSGAWAPVHALILAGLILVTAGLSGLARGGLLSGAALRAAQVAVAGAALSALEMTFHLVAFIERDAAVADRPTPLIDIHQALQVPSHPLLGFAVATLAVLDFRRLRGSALDWPWRIATTIGALGGVAHGLAGPLTILARDARFGSLFAGAGPMALYLGLYALAASRFQSGARREAAESVSAAV